LETKARLEAQVVGSGHSFASGRIGARYSVSEFVAEKMSGIEYLHFIRQLAKVSFMNLSQPFVALHQAELPKSSVCDIPSTIPSNFQIKFHM
jgi:Zn-dependent M16 (insulinase) family peptidase